MFGSNGCGYKAWEINAVIFFTKENRAFLKSILTSSVQRLIVMFSELEGLFIKIFRHLETAAGRYLGYRLSTITKTVKIKSSKDVIVVI